MGTGRRNQQKKEAALRYRLEMTALTRTGAGEVAAEYGERMAKIIRGIASTASVLRYQK